MTTDVVKAVIREPGTETPRQYAQRVHRLALIYFGLFFVSLAGVALILWRGKLFVTLAQRSNVETLTIAFFLVFFLYVAALSRSGMTGAVLIGYYHLLARFKDGDTVERRKYDRLGDRDGRRSVALNVVLEREGHRDEAFTIAIGDGIGSMGSFIVDGAKVTHTNAHRGGSNNIFAFLVHQLMVVLRERGSEVEIDVVQWKSIDDEATLQFLGLVEFARNLGRHLGVDQLWPKVTVTDNDIAEVESRLARIAPALRDEALLPDWEYSAEHKVPIVPEPLGLASLSRTEGRADPIATMGLALLIVALAVGILAMFIVLPPWVPGV
jgi:hypothetical protein